MHFFDEVQSLSGGIVAAITIRDLEDDLKRRLQEQAAEHGVSMEAEARRVLREGVREPSAKEAILEALGPDWTGVEFEVPQDVLDRPLPDFD